jgi:hypothetical protein
MRENTTTLFSLKDKEAIALVSKITTNQKKIATS